MAAKKKLYKRSLQSRRLYRSEKKKVVAGVFGGLGDYFDVDPSILRLGWLCIVVFTGFFPGIFAYIVAALIVPQKS